MRRVVDGQIDSVLASEPAQRNRQLQALREAFIPWLATFDPDTDQPIRRVARLNDLPQDSHPLIDALVATTLLTTDVRDGETVVEIAKETLLRRWDQLARWLRGLRDDLKAADDLERAAAAWWSNDRGGDWLVTGGRLAEAELLCSEPGFSQRLVAVMDYISASRDAENERIRAEAAQVPEAAPSRTGVFISYRRDDEPFAVRMLYDMLCRHFDEQNIFMDIDNIPWATISSR